MLIAYALIFHEWDSEPARIGNPGQFHNNDGPRALILGELRCQLGKLCRVWFHHPALPMQPDDIRWPVEGAEHQDNPAVLLQVSNSLHSAAGHVQIGDSPRSED